MIKISHSEILFNEEKVIERLYVPLWVKKLYIRTDQEFSKEKSEDLCSNKSYLGH